VARVLDQLSQQWLSIFVGLAVMVYLFLRSRRVSRLAYQYDEVALLGAAQSAFPTEVEIRFSGRPVPRVAACRMVVWNAGNTTLRGTDIVGGDPLRIELESDGWILKSSIVKVTREVNDFAVNLDETDARMSALSFDYLDPGDGAVLEILHSGERRALRVTGTMRGLRPGPMNFGRIDAFPERWQSVPRLIRVVRSRVAWVGMFGLGVVFAVLGLGRPLLHDVIPAFYADFASPPNPDQPSWALVVLGILYAGLPVVWFWMRRRRYPSQLDVGELADTECEGEG